MSKITMCLLSCIYVFTFHFFAQCIPTTYMYIFPTKVKSLSIECMNSIVKKSMQAIYSTAQVPIKIGVRITDPSPANHFYG